MVPYSPPLDQLLRLGDADTGPEWRDYEAMGIGPEHVPDLIRMATDADLILMADEEAEAGDEMPSWAPHHALRALGQLGADEAAGPLLEGLDRLIDIHDYWVEDLGDVMAALGPGALPECRRALLDDNRSESVRIVVSEAFDKIGSKHPEARDDCIAALMAQLERHDEKVAALNGFVISSLIDLKAVEVAPAIEAAFAADCVDETIVGDWPSVRYDLGLGPKPESRKQIERRIAAVERGLDPDAPPSRPDLNTLKKKQKRQKNARKQQRKRKK